MDFVGASDCDCEGLTCDKGSRPSELASNVDLDTDAVPRDDREYSHFYQFVYAYFALPMLILYRNNSEYREIVQEMYNPSIRRDDSDYM